jgi:propanediol dehydratase small subunit
MFSDTDHRAAEISNFIGQCATYYAIRKVVDASGHEHAADGKFGHGGSGAAKKPSKTKRKIERRTEAAQQATLGGGGQAVQTLLGGGGSALDKLGWLKTSPKLDEKPKEPEKPKSKETAKPVSVKDTIRENLKSGKLKRETVIDAVRTMQQQAQDAKSKGDYTTAKDLMFRVSDMVDAAGIKSHELISAKKPESRQPVPTRTRTDSRNDPFAGDPLHDPLPRGYGVRSPKETERHIREHPSPKKETAEDYDREYEARTGRKFDPMTA